MEQTKSNGSGITWVGLLFMIYITAWKSYTGDSVQMLLYGGYALVCVVTLLAILFYQKGTGIIMSKYMNRIFLFALFCVSSILWATDMELAIDTSIFIVVCIAMTILLSNYYIRLGNVNMLFLTIVVIGIVLSVKVIANEGGLGAFFDSATRSAEQELKYGERVGGELFNANIIGLSCAYSTIVLFGYALYYKKRYCYVLMFFLIVILIASASRKAILLLVVGACMTIYYHQKEQKNIQKYFKILIGVVLAIVLLRVVLSLKIMYTISQRIESFFDFFSGNTSAGNHSSTGLRYEMIRIGIKQFLYRPFLGIGVGNSQVLNAIKLNFRTYSHNDYIEHLVNGGIVGFVLYYSMFWMMIKDYIKLLKEDKDPQIVISFIIMIMLLVSNIACVTYYIDMGTYIFFILWFSQLEIKKRQKQPEMVIDEYEYSGRRHE